MVRKKSGIETVKHQELCTIWTSNIQSIVETIQNSIIELQMRSQKFSHDMRNQFQIFKLNILKL